ncbi:peptide chain release factor N(5)-glutamine methyltransferase [Lentibacillus sp. JNUCC-1]|uniref:peptide chain release factor N(5)-glutamine methyltransferase n=1 Tax=Lentibacillus sp. JNUCC-1 TaxID=2654513 RepID=UPI0012E716F0|nr:peptide chain release factor N(5)-glutamine methyltransferase [Lentibacillus sp. JNUCC-1]
MNKAIKQYEVLNRASLFLQQHNREEKVAELLLMHHLGVSRSAFFAMMRDEIEPEILNPFWRDVEKHAQTGVPVQHLTGYESFYGRRFTVTPDVLVPRPETEELVEHILNAVKDKTRFNHPLTIADIGTGSGIIATTLALELPDAVVYGTDVSEKALKVARRNAEMLEAEVTFYQGDFLQPLIDHNRLPQIIVSNPPYIAHSEKDLLADTVRDYDPELALFADNDGLAAYEAIIRQSQKLPVKMLAFEIGHTQSKPITALIKKAYPEARVDTIQDINQKNRIITAQLYTPTTNFG